MHTQLDVAMVTTDMEREEWAVVRVTLKEYYTQGDREMERNFHTEKNREGGNIALECHRGGKREAGSYLLGVWEWY